MSSVVQSQADAAAPASPTSVELVSWPLRDDKLPSTVVLTAAIAVAGGAGLVAASWFVGLVSLAALIAALWRIWMPVHLQLGPRGVIETVARRQRRLPWASIRRCVLYRDGILLLPDERLTLPPVLRGLYVRWANRRTEVLAVVRHYVRCPGLEQAD